MIYCNLFMHMQNIRGPAMNMLSAIPQTSLLVPNFAKANSDFGKKNRILDKQTAPFETIKHQRDKQIFIVHRTDIQLFNINKGC